VNTLLFRLLFVIACFSAAACSSSSDTTDQAATLILTDGTAAALKVVTWNVEHLASPIDAGCRPRSIDELAAMQAYAQRLDADIVALQEVASLDAVGLLFPAEEWQLFLSDRPDSASYECRESGRSSTQQKLAFAVRKGLEVENVVDVEALGLDDPGLRHGMELTVATPLGPVELLNVHLKSGCFVDDFSRADTEACQLFTRQAPILDAWIEEREASSQPYIVLGDFNHRISAPYNQLTRVLGQNTDGSASSLINTTADMLGCHPWYPAPIDHILIGNMQDPALITSTRAHDFEDMDPEAMLSDHCAVSLTLQYGQLPLSNSVVWHTASKEYAFLTTGTYQRAASILASASLPETPWAVAMDIDETVLDNSAYQVMIDRTGRSFTPDSWAAWVASEEATLVPGVAAFIGTVLDLGGKLAFITNRDREQDHHTWRNMQALGLPITLDNTCLMGRSATDRRSVDERTRFNDKDLRRQQIQDGSASCYASETARHSDFPAATIVMQVGDNIEDFAGVTQESAAVDALLSAGSTEFILLPNAMYGSW
jgi:5'-nucleotidase (lipoprotein e(P4) family)